MSEIKIMDWVEFYGNASAFAALAHVAKDRDAADNFAANADLALSKVRAWVGAASVATADTTEAGPEKERS